MNKWKWVCIPILIIFMIFAEIYRELHSFVVTNYKIISPKLTRQHRIVFLSDLHNRCYGDGNSKLFNAIKKEHPEFILIGGDMLVGKNGYPYDIAEQFVTNLTEICPVYYANGNHEQRLKEKPEKYELSYADYKKSLCDAGVIFLENESITLEANNDHIALSGLEIPLDCYTHFKKKEMPQGTVKKCLGECRDDFQILLAHNPVYMKNYLAWGADIVFSGHLHGGMMRLPGIGGVVSPDFELFPRYSGEMREINGQYAVTSKGLGTHTINIRFMNPAEVVVLNLIPQNNVQNEF